MNALNNPTTKDVPAPSDAEQVLTGKILEGRLVRHTKPLMCRHTDGML